MTAASPLMAERGPDHGRRQRALHRLGKRPLVASELLEQQKVNKGGCKNESCAYAAVLRQITTVR